MKRAGADGWMETRANRATLLVDAADYFRALRASMEAARHSISIIGWDIYSSLQFDPMAPEGERCELAGLLDSLTKRRPTLCVRILTWDYAPIFLGEREFLPVVQFAWKTGRRVRLRLAADHPVGASHHQKIVVVDDRTAFIGGVDLTVARWDEHPHRLNHPGRRLPDGGSYGPFHDLQLCVDGGTATALGDLFRDRWRRATGEVLLPVSGEVDSWPAGLAPDFESVRVRLLRTMAAYHAHPAVREVEAHYLYAIGEAAQAIYFENQYLTAESIRVRLCQVLEKAAGPEVVIVTPKVQSGRLEQATMGALRERVVRSLRDADAHGRLRVLSPVVGRAQEEAVNVHAKLMIVDDRFLRVGSANLSNRSMGLDTECDAVVEAEGALARARVLALRDGLIAEHLGLSRARVAEQIERSGSLVAAIDALCRVAGEQRLVELPTGTQAEEALPLALHGDLADPHEPLDVALARHALPDGMVQISSRRAPRVLLAAAVVVGLSAAWLWTPLSEWADPRRLADAARLLRSAPLGMLIATGLLLLASLLMIPVTALIVAVSLVFDVWSSLAICLVGCLTSAACAYVIGRVLWRDTVRKLAGKRLNRLSQNLARQGVAAIAAVRVLPVAPFTVVNLVAGASYVEFKDFVLGTAIGMGPGILALSLTSGRIAAAVRDPGPMTVVLSIAVVAAALALLTWIRRLAVRIGSKKDRTHGAR